MVIGSIGGARFLQKCGTGRMAGKGTRTGGGRAMNREIDQSAILEEADLDMLDRKGFELVDGVWVEKNVGFESGYVAGELFARLRQHCRDHALGWVFSGNDGGYRCFPHRPGLIRKPDVSFVRVGRLPDEKAP